jgi:hypothetical protein
MDSQLISRLDSSLVECLPATQATGVQILPETCLSRDALLRIAETLVKFLLSGDPDLRIAETLVKFLLSGDPDLIASD